MSMINSPERFQLKSFREDWMVYDSKTDLYALFNLYDSAIKNHKLLLAEPLRVSNLKWHTHKELIK